MFKKHSVLLKEDLCEGCTNCVIKCPTKAIRVHQGKATIKEELCIDCGECIRTCAYHAKYSRTDTLLDLNKYDNPVALVPPSFYGQFENTDPAKILGGLYKLGFKGVYDVAETAQALTMKTYQYLINNKGLYISSSCPVVVRLIKILYPELLGHLLPLKSPVELMAERVKDELIYGDSPISDVGIYFITPCPAKHTTVYNPLGMNRSFLDGAIAVDMVYKELIKVIDDIDIIDIVPEDYSPPYLGIGWGRSGGELDNLKSISEDEVLSIKKETISISGIHNVKNLLEELSRNNLKGVKYIELNACSKGCVGGVLNVKNPYQASVNIRSYSDMWVNSDIQDLSPYSFKLSFKFKSEEVGKLDEDISRAMEKLSEMENEIKILPGLDCAACGAPDCRTLAEDIVNGRAKRTDCIFVLRKRVGALADRMSELAHALPPVMKEKKNDNEQNSDE